MIEKKVYEKIDVLSKYQIIVDQVDPLRPSGKIVRVAGMALYSHGPEVKIGEICRVLNSDGKVLSCEVVGFDQELVVLMPMGPLYGVYPGSTVLATGRPLYIPLDHSLLGRVIGGDSEPLDGKGAIFSKRLQPIDADPPNPLTRPVIRKQLATGVKAIDGFLSVGRGQRIGIFAGSGVGKSTLMGMIARYTDADVNVIALVGERGRELNEFIENDLGKEGMQRSVVVCATSDQPAVLKISAAMIATTIAEYFREEGLHVNLMMDSLTRFAHAVRDVGASTREPVTTRGYPSSMGAKISRLVERAGSSREGSITGFYTILVDSDDLNDPVADAVRGFLDGHIVLSRDLAAANHYPAVDVLESVSRVMKNVVPEEPLRYADFVRKYMAIYRENEAFIKAGAYSHGSNPDIDMSLQVQPMAVNFLQQTVGENVSLDNTFNQLRDIYGALNEIEEQGEFIV